MSHESTPEMLPFRREAAEHYRHRQLEGRALRIAPRWTRYTYWLLVWTMVAAVVFVCVGRIDEYARSPAVVRLRQREPLTAPVAGRVATVLVEPGQRIAAGTPLLRLDASAERAELDRIERERFALTARFLADPGDDEARRGMGTLRAEEARARALLRDKTIVAPYAARVGDVWVRPGQPVSPGDEIVTLVRGEAGAEVIAIVPAHFRPRLRPGLDLRLELPGLAHAYRHLVIESVGDEAIGPAEVRRYLGPGLGDALSLDGSAVLVHARLDDPWVESGGERYPLHDGMLGESSVLVKRERILFAVLPGLRELLMEDPP